MKPIIHATLIEPHLTVTDYESVIRALGQRLEAAGYVKESFVPAVLEREALYPTGLPLGQIDAAIPHTDVEHVLTPGIAIATLEQPVHFGQMGSPNEAVAARIVFLLAMKDPEVQVTLLQNLVALFQKADVLAALLATDQASTIEQIMNRELQLTEV